MKNCKACGKKLLIGVGALIILGIIKSVLKGSNTFTTKTATRSSSATSPTSPTSAAAVPTPEVATVNIKFLELTGLDYAGWYPVNTYPQGSWVVKLSIQSNLKGAINVNSLKDLTGFTMEANEGIAGTPIILKIN